MRYFGVLKKSKLKKRLRKKFHLGEFQEFGFKVSVNFKKETNEFQFDKFWHEFIDEIESHELICGGGDNCKTWEVFVTSNKKFDSPTNEKRMAIQKWLENYSEIEDFKIGESEDAWKNPN